MAKEKITLQILDEITRRSRIEKRTAKDICEEMGISVNTYRCKLVKLKKAGADLKEVVKNEIKETALAKEERERYESVQRELEKNSPKSFVDMEIQEIRELKRNERKEAKALKQAIREKYIDKDTGLVKANISTSDLKKCTDAMKILQDVLYRSYAVVKDVNLSTLGNNDIKEDVIRVEFINAGNEKIKNDPKLSSNVNGYNSSAIGIQQNNEQVSTAQETELDNQKVVNA